MKTDIEKTIEELNKPMIVRTGWISNGPGSAGLADISEVFPIEEYDVPNDGLAFLKRNGWWREESDDEVLQRHYWIR